MVHEAVPRIRTKTPPHLDIMKQRRPEIGAEADEVFAVVRAR
jgi:hypothetical protein